MQSRSNHGRLNVGITAGCFLALLGFVVVTDADPIPGTTDAATHPVATPPEESQDAPKKLYVVLFRKGPGFVEGGGSQPGMVDHITFVKKAHSDGIVPLAGALFADDEGKQVDGTLYFVRAENLQAARVVVMKEPFVRERVVQISSIWRFALGVGNLD